MDFWKSLQNEKIAIDQAIEDNFSLISNIKLRESSAHLIRAGGKRIRPLLLTLAHKVAGGNNLKAISIASTAIEYLHNWTLIHDDIIDESETRRKSPTVHKKWDTNTAILAGDILQNLIFLMIAKDKSLGKNKDKITEILAETAIDILDGEMLDVDFEKSSDITEEEYFEMIYKKTATLIKSSIKIGAVLATDDEKIINALSDYGYSIGIAFQIQDDLLDLLGEEEKVGKSLGRDIAEGKRTLMVIHSLNNASQELKNKLLEILDKKENTSEEIKQAIDIIKQTGSIKYAQSILKKFISESKTKLEIIPDSKYKSELIELADFFEIRSY